MSRARTVLAILLPVLALLPAPAAALASFGFRGGAEGFAAVAERGGAPYTIAGTHPDAVRIHFGFNTDGGFTEGDLRNLMLAMPPGFLAAPVAVNECSPTAFNTPRGGGSLSGESCPNSTQVGVVGIRTSRDGGEPRYFGVYNLAPPEGTAGAIGFAPFGVPIELTAGIREADATLVFHLRNLPQRLDVQEIDLTLWGTPWSEANDGHRGDCLDEETGGSLGSCLVFDSASAPLPLIKSFLTLPTSPCGPPMSWEAAAVSWDGETSEAKGQSEDSEGHPMGLTKCLPSRAIGDAKLRTGSAATATGFVFHLEINDGGGLFNQLGHVTAPAERAVVTLPEGLTINPSLGAGLGVCSEADFAREEIGTAPGAGCPNASKIGAVEVEGLMGSSVPVSGAVYLAQPYKNPFQTLIGLYIVVSSPRRGLFQKAFGKVEADPTTGRLVATFEHLPQLHYTQFELSLREGQRAAMISPPACGGYGAQLELTPWSDPNERIHDTTTFFITSGEGGGPCPSGGLAPFTPALEAGSLNPQAGAYTPFYLHMSRTDADQEITSYSATFPPGLLGKIGGVPFCPDSAIEAAARKSGTEELEQPSCPAASSIGHTLSGYGVGDVLAYAPGGLYLAGPYHGAPLSIVAIDSALVGPFDLGVVIVRSAIRVDPLSTQVSIDSAGSDPIPHILKGIPIHLRDIRVYVDRPGFTVNPTSCDKLETHSLLTGAGLDVFSSADDVGAVSSDRYQLANCSALGFTPKLRMKLRGSNKRGGFPSLRATVTEHPGDANIGQAIVTLPHTEFLAPGHIRDICTLKQYAVDACPASSVYGHARTTSPLLAEALEGPVYLRSSPLRPLPDMVVSLRGANGLAVELVGRIDSTKAGGMRASFETLPDAPAGTFTLTLNGGKRGLLENSADLCSGSSFATSEMISQSNAVQAKKVRMEPECKGRKHGKKRKGKR